MNEICVVMGDDRPVLAGEAARSSYPSLAYEINRRFCEQHGFSFRYEYYQLEPRPWGKLAAYCAAARQHRASSWVKILAVLRALDMGYERVVWIDSDCVFFRHDAEWSDFFGFFDDPGVQLASWVDRPFNPNQLCAGFFAVRNSAEVRALLRDIWCRQSATSTRHPYEQAEFVRYLKAKPATWHRLVDEPMFALESPDQRLLHIASHDRPLTIPLFLRWFEERGLLPHPQGIDTLVYSDLDLSAADALLSGSAPRAVDVAGREIWALYQSGVGIARKIRSRLRAGLRDTGRAGKR